MRELNEIILEKELFVSIKGQLCLAKRLLANQKGYVEVKHPTHQKLFLTL